MPPKGFWGTLQETGVGQCGERSGSCEDQCAKLERSHAGTQRVYISMSPSDRWKTETFFFFFSSEVAEFTGQPSALSKLP